MISFSSLEFLFRFLPIFLAAYFVLPSKYRELVLLLGSIVFYTIGEPVFILLLIAATALNYLLAVQEWKVGEGFSLHEWQKQARKKYMISAVALDVLLLVMFKLLGTFVDNSLLPLGISFYIFKMISFQVDVYRKEISVKPEFRHVMLYFMMFPQVVSGPIMRYNEGEFDLDRTCSLEQFEEGLQYFVLGLGMKVLPLCHLSAVFPS